MSDDGGQTPFRQSARVHSTVLAALAERGPDARRSLIAEARALPVSERRARLRKAVPCARGGWGWIPIAVLFVGALLLLEGLTRSDEGATILGMIVASFSGLMWWHERALADRAVATELAWPTSLSFPVTGYADWLVATRPLLDVTLSAAVDEQLLTDAAHGIDPSIEVEMMDERVVRYALRPLQHAVENPTFTGDPKVFRAFATALLAPLHNEIGIESVEMGGAMRRVS
ncbi:MAG TPA: hypothetical protein VML75_04395 [Kofleriaceae bacterium]|nr:hypothetical protein [Kofleriaceae bacterium]